MPATIHVSIRLSDALVRELVGPLTGPVIQRYIMAHGLWPETALLKSVHKDPLSWGYVVELEVPANPMPQDGG
jgi:hypothetical protein